MKYECSESTGTGGSADVDGEHNSEVDMLSTTVEELGAAVRSLGGFLDFLTYIGQKPLIIICI